MISAIILAAGRGSRAWPYSGVRQKVTMPVLNVPMVRYLALCIKQCGIDDIVVVVGHRAPAVRSCLAGIEGVHFAEQYKPEGTADATLVGINSAQGEDVLVCYGDVVSTAKNIQLLLDKFSTEHNAGQLLTSRPFPGATLAAHVGVERSGRVANLCYKSANECRRCYGGMMVVRKDLLKSCLLANPGIIENVSGPMPALEADLVCSLNLLCEEGTELGFVDCQDFLVDVDKPWQFAAANALASQHLFHDMEFGVSVAEGASISDKAIIDPNVKIVLGPNARIGDYCRIQSSVLLEAGAQLEHGVYVLPGGGVVLGQNACAENFAVIGAPSVIGARSHIGHGANFVGLMFENVSIRHAAQVCAVLGERVNVAGGVMTSNWRFDNGTKEQLVGKHRETPERYGDMTYIGDYVRLGNNVTFSPGTRVGAYSCIGSGIWVNEDVPERSLLLLQQEIIRKEWGPERYGW